MSITQEGFNRRVALRAREPVDKLMQVLAVDLSFVSPDGQKVLNVGTVGEFNLLTGEISIVPTDTRTPSALENQISTETLEAARQAITDDVIALIQATGYNPFDNQG